MKKPLIGIVPLVDTEKESYWMLPGYMTGIEQAGGIPVMLPLTTDSVLLEQLVDTMDAFLFTGGHDVNPAIYQELPSAQCGECCLERDEMETLLFSLSLKQNKPILGICRGIQLINALLGGTLYQDLPTEHPSKLEHHQSAPYDKPIHTVTLVEDTPLYQLLKEERIPVNSYHHQAIKALSPKLLPMAYADDGLVEAVYLPDARFMWAVQWHPEFSYCTDERSRKILAQFVTAATL